MGPSRNQFARRALILATVREWPLLRVQPPVDKTVRPLNDNPSTSDRDRKAMNGDRRTLHDHRRALHDERAPFYDDRRAFYDDRIMPG